jgi:competence ComEA-like helix-hairpin-helix protein
LKKLLFITLITLSLFGEEECRYSFDINSASKEDFNKIPNFTTQLSRKIVQKREEIGEFRSLQHLRENIPEIGAEKLANIIRHIDNSKICSPEKIVEAPKKVSPPPEKPENQTPKKPDKPEKSEFQKLVDNYTAVINSPRDGLDIGTNRLDIYSPFLVGEKERREVGTTTENSSGCSYTFDINRATEEDFQKVVGVDKKIASEIVYYRKSRGLFKRVDDLIFVKGVGKRELENIRSYYFNSMVCPKVKTSETEKESIFQKKASIPKLQDLTQKSVKKSRNPLQIIFNNRAKISGKWYKIGDRYGRYRVVDVGENFVKIVNGRRVKYLTFGESRKDSRIEIEVLEIR